MKTEKPDSLPEYTLNVRETSEGVFTIVSIQRMSGLNTKKFKTTELHTKQKLAVLPPTGK